MKEVIQLVLFDVPVDKGTAQLIIPKFNHKTKSFKPKKSK